VIEEKLKRQKRFINIGEKIGELTVISISPLGTIASCTCSCGKENVKRKVVTLKTVLASQGLKSAYCYDCKKLQIAGKLSLDVRSKPSEYTSINSMV